MGQDNNKTELFKMLDESMTHLDTGKTTIITTSLENLAANTIKIDLSTMQPCNHEEADSSLHEEAEVTFLMPRPKNFSK